MKQKTLLLIDAVINLILGSLLLFFPASTATFLGVPPITPRFYPSILGAILFGVGLALLIERAKILGLTGLGLGGAVAINLSGGIILAGWLIFGALSIPVRGLVFLWGLVFILVGISTAELVIKTKSYKMVKITHVALWTHDLERLRDFYQQWFGAASNQKYTNPKTGFQSYFLDFGVGPRLEIMYAPDVGESGSGKQAGYAHIALAVGSEDEVRSLTARMESAGIKVASPPRTTGDGYIESVVLDPDGNHVEITV